MPEQSFDRLRPRGDDATDATRVPDREGKQALFSSQPEPPTLGSVALRCTLCDARSVVSWAKAVRLAFPAVPAALPGAGARLWMRCPTCGRRAWVVISLKS